MSNQGGDIFSNGSVMKVYYAWEVIHWQCFFLGFRGAGQGQSRGKYFKWGGEGLSVMEVYSAGGGERS